MAVEHIKHGSGEPTGIEADVVKILDEEKGIQAQEAELMQNPAFVKWIEAQKAFKSRSEILWAAVFNEMEANNIKSIKGDWGSITVTERASYKAVDPDVVPRKFFKKELDVKKVGDQFKLTGKLPAGVESSLTRFLMKRLK